jgi:aldehyde dehydrogenase (NAD+)
MAALHVAHTLYTQGDLDVFSPITAKQIAQVTSDTPSSVDQKIALSQQAFRAWRQVPAPTRGALVHSFGQVLRAHKEALGALVTLEAGKVRSEGLGEVQEMIDICDFAVGLSRQLYGLTIPSERPGHLLREVWHPLGPVGIISAFNFPVAVWSWNATLALVCGNSLLWKPSEKTPLTALAVQSLFATACLRFTQESGIEVPFGLSQLLLGKAEIGQLLVDDPRVPLVSATGSTRMGRAVGQRLAARFGRALLELGGNNATIVTPSANIELATRAIAFGAMGTAGQRCTTLRRLFVHESLYDALIARLKAAYATVKIGDPREEGVLVGPLIDAQAQQMMLQALEAAKQQGGQVFAPGHISDAVKALGGAYVAPTLVEMPSQSAIVQQETFAPILYVMRYQQLEDAIAALRDVPQGLSSSIITTDMREMELFLSAVGSDCGIANVNMGTSGAEIGGAFGGEKETGGGRESGSDSWKAYMRRQTQAINYSSALPLAQGVTFDLERDDMRLNHSAGAIFHTQG